MTYKEKKSPQIIVDQNRLRALGDSTLTQPNCSVRTRCQYTDTDKNTCVIPTVAKTMLVFGLISSQEGM